MPRRWTHWLRLLVIGAVALMAIACTSAPDQNTIQKPSETGANPAPDQSYAFSQKEEYTTAMKSNLDKLNQEIDQLAEKVAHVAAAARADAAEKLQKLRDQAQRLRQQFDKVQDASAGSWDLVKSDIATGYADLRSGIRSARQWLSEKIAP